MQPTLVFQRVEKKYPLTREQEQRVRRRLLPQMLPDPHGESTVCNVYYDTVCHDLIRRSVERPVYKEKLRMRCYGPVGPADTVFLEIKKKYKGTVGKRRLGLPLEQAEEFLRTRCPPPGAGGQIAGELAYFMQVYDPRPAAFVAYERQAYFGREDGDVRVTFDYNIRARQERLSLAAGTDGEPVDGPFCLLEIKTLDAMPLWLARILGEEEIYPNSFSKYGSVYLNKICANEVSECSKVSLP